MPDTYEGEIMKKELRKVTFSLNGADVLGFQHLNLGDIVSGNKNPKEYDKQHNGLFHVWGNGIQTDDEGHHFPVTFAIVELNDGNIVEVPPTNIKFEN